MLTCCYCHLLTCCYCRLLTCCYCHLLTCCYCHLLTSGLISRVSRWAGFSSTGESAAAATAAAAPAGTCSCAALPLDVAESLPPRHLRSYPTTVEQGPSTGSIFNLFRVLTAAPRPKKHEHDHDDQQQPSTPAGQQQQQQQGAMAGQQQQQQQRGGPASAPFPAALSRTSGSSSSSSTDDVAAGVAGGAVCELQHVFGGTAGCVYRQRCCTGVMESGARLAKFAPRSFDTVVDTFGLCSHENPILVGHMKT